MPAGGFDMVHADLLFRYADLVTDLGGDPQSMISAAGIDPGASAARTQAGSYAQVARLLERSAAMLSCPDFGLRLARLQGGKGMFGPLGAVMLRAATFGDALDFVARHAFAHSLAARITLRRLPDGAVFVGHDVLLDGASERLQLIEQILLLGHLNALDITGGHARARQVTLRHRPALPLPAVRRFFGCAVVCDGAADGVMFHASDLRQPIVSSDAQAYERAVAIIDAQFTRERPPLHAELRGVVTRLVGSAACTNARAAAELGLHPRTLLRRLDAEGTSFQRIKDEVRRDLMLYYLQRTDLEIARISERLGYAEQSVMTRRCRLWFGASPTQVRAGRSSRAERTLSD